MEDIYKNIRRFNADVSKGLSSELVNIRKSQGLLNVDTTIKSRTVKDIIKDNLFTLFNLVNAILALALIYTGSYKNLMFVIVVICNSVISIIQEIRSKKTIDKLNLISSKFIKAIRGGKETKLAPEDIVLDDIVKYSAGNQIVADSLVIDGFCEVNESLLTGEPDLISKKCGDILLSGSFVSAGSCYAQVHRVGKDNYSSKILHGVKYIKNTTSQIMDFLKKLIKFISIAIVPIGILLFISQLKALNNDLNSAITGTSAALIGMIPEGLVLLTSTALALGVMRLAKKKVLVQDIYCIETLARVDTLCLDKTGTITSGKLEVIKAIPQNGFSEDEIKNSLNMFVRSLNDVNDTFVALKNKFYTESNNNINVKADEIIPFSSSKKWSGVSFKDKGTYVVGALEFIFKNNAEEIHNIVKEYSKEYRVLVFAHSNKPFANKDLPNDMNLIALILLKDKIRKNAKKTLEFFLKQGVNIKIISGDSPLTVSNIAKEAGVPNFNDWIDMTTIKTLDELNNVAGKYTIFGRVTPKQKKDLIKALKITGHTVAMTGDGVNDVLALKEADCSIAMASGSDAARTVSHITLLDSDFVSLPSVVAEGRQVINNIQRSSSLFITKTIYSCILAILFLLVSAPYPFIPIQMTLISSLAIGIPSFILALEPNSEKIHGSFTHNILKNSLPAALMIVFNIAMAMLAYIFLNISQGQYSTICLILTGIVEILLLYKISIPLNKHRKILLNSVFYLFIISILFFRSLFSIYTLNLTSIIICALIFIADILIIKSIILKN